MASGEKQNSIYTRSGNGSGKSEGLERSSMARGHGPSRVDNGGQEDLAAYPMDNVQGMRLPDTKGGKMGGSSTNLSHSLSGASAVQK